MKIALVFALNILVKAMFVYQKVANKFGLDNHCIF